MPIRSLLSQTSLFASPSGLMVLGRDLIIQECNLQAASTFGYTQEELRGEHINKLLPEWIKADHDSLVNKFAEKNASRILSGSSGSCLFEAIKKDGSSAHVQIGITIVQDENGQPRFIVALSDSTELLALNKKLSHTNDELKAKFEEIEKLKFNQSHLLQVMSHELKSPLHVTLSLLALLSQEGNTVEEQADFSNTLASQIDYVNASLRLLVDFADIQEGRFQLQVEPSNLRDLISQSIESVKSLYNSQQVEFSLEFDKPLTEFVLLDRGRMQTAITGIFANSIKHGKATRIRCQVELGDCVPPCLRLNIEDNGCGIPPDILEQITQPLANLDYRRSLGSGGLGIGLSVYNHYFSQAGGDIRISNDSSLGGTKVSLSLTMATAQRPAKLLKDTSTTEQPLLGLDILLTDDDKIITKVIGLRLQRMGASVTTAANGLEAVSFANDSQNNPFDLILMDLDMPVMNGYEAITQIRKLDAYKTTPIFAVSAGLESQTLPKAEEAGATGCYAKPFDLSLLVGLLSGS